MGFDVQIACTSAISSSAWPEQADEPPFFNAAVLYMGNGFMHARDVLGTVQADVVGRGARKMGDQPKRL